MGFFIPTVLIPDVEDLVLIGQRLRILYYGVAFVCFACFIATIIGKLNLLYDYLCNENVVD